ncbi:MAG TPA: type II toxin-antitoxin system VapC family toxin [Terriglobales bacterium]
MLIDTNALLWYALEPRRLSPRARAVIHEQGNFYSYASVWELAIKSSLGKLKLTDQQGQPSDARQFMLNLVRNLGLKALFIEFDDVAGVERLPFHHRDPFDRLLALQAQRNNLPIVSADPVFERYGVKRVW